MLEEVRQAMLRLFIAAEGASLRKEDEQKSREVAALLPHLARVKRGAHVVDAAAGKASVALVAAELLPLARVTVIERDPARVAACRAAARRLGRTVDVDVRESDVGSDVWPSRPDVVVALHACGAATDAAIDGAIRCGARHVLVAPCCYGAAIPSWSRARASVATLVSDPLLARRMTAALVDMERKCRLEAARYETRIEQFVAPTVTPHNLLFVARKTA
jgi:hypothetical protein